MSFGILLFFDKYYCLWTGLCSKGVRVMVLNTTFKNISFISWLSVLLVEETGVPGENHWPVASHWQTVQKASKELRKIPVITLSTLFYWHAYQKYLFHFLGLFLEQYIIKNKMEAIGQVAWSNTSSMWGCIYMTVITLLSL